MKLAILLTAFALATPALADSTNPVVRQNQLRERVEAAEHRRHINDNRVRHEFREADKAITQGVTEQFRGIESLITGEIKTVHGLVAGAAVPLYMDLDRGLQVAGGFGVTESGAGFKGSIGYGMGNFLPSAFALVTDDGDWVAGASVTVAFGDLF